MRLALTALLVSVAVAGCSAELTEIVIEVRSDLSVPDDIDRIRIDVSRPMGAVESAEADLAELPLPRSLALVHRGGALGPIEVSVTGVRAGVDVLTRRSRVSFEEGQRLVLVVTLDAACTTATCAATSTCEHGGCRPIDVDACEYEGRQCVDAGVGDAAVGDGACGAEVCDGDDDDCDGLVDEGFDLMTSVDHCGRCGRQCTPTGSHATGAECVGGACVLTCDPDFGDCDRDPANGCEVDLMTTMDHCGGCGVFCPSAGTFHAADAVCAGGRCLLSCDPDWGDCDTDRSTGCEAHVTVDNEHCGTCGNACAPPEMCRSSACS